MTRRGRCWRTWGYSSRALPCWSWSAICVLREGRGRARLAAAQVFAGESSPAPWSGRAASLRRSPRPPSWPPPGPRSITQSARAMTSRLCSMTITVCGPIDQAVEQRRPGSRRPAMCRPARRLVEHVDRGVRRHLDRELESLALAARQRVQLLPERDVSEAHVRQPVEHHLDGLLNEEVAAPPPPASPAPRRCSDRAASTGAPHR